MEAELRYYAKDGRQFTDPLRCQEYERTLGLLPGTVGKAKVDLKAFGEDKYVTAIVCVLHDDKSYSHTFITMKIDHLLEDYVNVNDLMDEKRYETATIRSILSALDLYDDDDLCEYTILYSDSMDMVNCGYTKTMNHKYWDVLEEHDKQRKEQKK